MLYLLNRVEKTKIDVEPDIEIDDENKCCSEKNLRRIIIIEKQRRQQIIDMEAERVRSSPVSGGVVSEAISGGIIGSRTRPGWHDKFIGAVHIVRTAFLLPLTKAAESDWLSLVRRWITILFEGSLCRRSAIMCTYSSMDRTSNLFKEYSFSKGSVQYVRVSQYS